TLLTATTDVSDAGGLTLQSASSGFASNLAVAAGKTLTVAAAGTLTANSGTGGPRVLSGTVTNNGTVKVNGTTLTLTGTLTNFAGSTLTGGTYQLFGGTFQFPNTGVATNAATVLLDGSSAQIVNSSNANSLA